MIEPLDPVAFARGYAAESPMWGSDSWEEPCCATCFANFTGFSKQRREVVHDRGCEWVRLRVHFGLLVPVEIDGTLHTYVGAEDE